MYSVYNQLDRLDVCIVGRCYGRNRIEDETNEDLANLQSVLETQFGVTVLRPTNDSNMLQQVITPRDYIGMIGNTLYVETYNSFWNDFRGPDWPMDAPITPYDWKLCKQRDELVNMFGVRSLKDLHKYEYQNVKAIIDSLDNPKVFDQKIDTAMTCRLGDTLIVGTWPHFDYPARVRELYPNHTIYVVDSEGHLDGTICVVNDSLIVVRDDTPVDIPGFETFYLKQTQHTGNPETYFDLNMLVVDRNNILCMSENEALFKKFEEHNITPHIVPFRHNTHWDAGLHCVTADLNRININIERENRDAKTHP